MAVDESRERASTVLPEHAADRVLVSRNDVQQPRCVALDLLAQTIDGHAVAPRRDADEACAESGEDVQSARVGRVLGEHAVAALNVQPGGEVNGLLRAGRDEYLLHAGGEPALREVAGDRFAQWWIAKRHIAGCLAQRSNLGLSILQHLGRQPGAAKQIRAEQVDGGLWPVSGVGNQ